MLKENVHKRAAFPSSVERVDRQLGYHCCVKFFQEDWLL
jgi:hypothetical protein